MNKYSRSVTLVEMVLVLVILFALVGVGVTLYPDISRRAIITGNITSLKEVANAVQLYSAVTFGGIPDNLDLLVDLHPSGVDYPASTVGFLRPEMVIATSVEGLDVIAAAIDTTGGTDSEDIIRAFNFRGVEEFAVHDINDTAGTFGGSSATFDYEGGLSVTLGTAGFTAPTPGGANGEDDQLLLVSSAEVETSFGRTDSVTVTGAGLDTATGPGAAYAIFGVGSRGSWVNNAECTGLLLAPIYIPDISPKVETLEEVGVPTGVTIDPDDFYSRFLVIFRIDTIRSGADPLGGLATPEDAEVGISLTTITFSNPVNTAGTPGFGSLDGLLAKLAEVYAINRD